MISRRVGVQAASRGVFPHHDGLGGSAPDHTFVQNSAHSCDVFVFAKISSYNLLIDHSLHLRIQLKARSHLIKWERCQLVAAALGDELATAVLLAHLLRTD